MYPTELGQAIPAAREANQMNFELETIRKKRRISIVELSRITGIEQMTIAMYEEGDKEIPQETAEVLLRALERRKD